MGTERRICTRGVWDTTVPGIKFSDDGQSNYSQIFDKLVALYPRGDRGRAIWRKMVESIKAQGLGKKYDCLIGVSGGTDSSFLLHLAKESGLRPLAALVDNGWSSDISVKNIKKMTIALNIDLETVVLDYEEIKDIMKSYIKATLPWVDFPTDQAIKSVLYRTAAREKN